MVNIKKIYLTPTNNFNIYKKCKLHNSDKILIFLLVNNKKFNYYIVLHVLCILLSVID